MRHDHPADGRSSGSRARAHARHPPDPDRPTAASSGLAGRLSGLVGVRALRPGGHSREADRRSRVLTVLAALLFGLAAAYSFRAADGALTRAGANTDQLVRVQAIQTKLIQADADATNAFLVGGLEPAEQRADYNAAVTSASKLIAEAARSSPPTARR